MKIKPILILTDFARKHFWLADYDPRASNGPEKPFFDKTWKLPDIEKVK